MKRKTTTPLKKFWRANWIEILAVCAVIAGIVVVTFERSWLTTAGNILSEGLGQLKNLVLRINFTDLAGTLIVIIGIALVLWRLRYRLQHSQWFLTRACPRCGTSLHRAHRTNMDRFIGFLVLPHSRRFRCNNPDCGWSGLRYGRHHTEESEKDLPVAAGPTTPV